MKAYYKDKKYNLEGLSCNEITFIQECLILKKKHSQELEEAVDSENLKAMHKENIKKADKMYEDINKSFLT